MSFFTRPPRGRLRGLVDRLWTLDDPGLAAEAETICPDGRTEIVLHLGDPMRQRAGTREWRQPRHLLVGQMQRPVTIAPTGRMAMVGARFVAGAFHRLVPMPQDRLTDSVIDLESVWGEWTRRAADCIAQGDGPAERLDILERLLETRIPDRDASLELQSMTWAASRLRATGGAMPIGRMSDQLGICRRQFERRFRDHIGLSPRLFGRIVRFQRAFERLGREGGAAIAAHCGYVDQAHMVREVRRFAGRTPTLLAEAEGLTAFFKG
jgi:AraC-like DNA-binding protein